MQQMLQQISSSVTGWTQGSLQIGPACLHQLLQRPKLCLLPIMPTPPWHIICPTYDLRLVRHNRKVTCHQCLMRSFPSIPTARMYNLQVIRSSSDRLFFRFCPRVFLVITAEFYSIYLKKYSRYCHFLRLSYITALQSLDGHTPVPRMCSKTHS
jgi:hypothetical protein